MLEAVVVLAFVAGAFQLEKYLLLQILCILLYTIILIEISIDIIGNLPPCII